MSNETAETKKMGVIGKITGVFSSPRETFEAINQKPTWLVPFLLVVITVIVMQYAAMDIAMNDQIAKYDAKGLTAQAEATRQQADSPFKFIGLIFVPLGTLAVWAIFAGIFLFTGNTIMGGEAKFKNIFSLLAWSSLIGIVGGALKTFLIVSKGTAIGVSTSLAALLPTPELSEGPSIFYRVFSRFEIFSIWSLVLWIIGFSVIYNFTTKKSATLVISLWAVYCVIAVALGGLLGGMFGG